MGSRRRDLGVGFGRWYVGAGFDGWVGFFLCSGGRRLKAQLLPPMLLLLLPRGRLLLLLHAPAAPGCAGSLLPGLVRCAEKRRSRP